MMNALIVLPLLFAVSFGYFITSDEIFQTKAAAEAHCATLGSNLASIHNLADLEEAQTLCRALPLAQGTVGCWLGLEQASESDPWLWSDGTPFDYGASLSGLPWARIDGGDNENCLQISAHMSWNWNDVSCFGPYDQYALCGAPASECQRAGDMADGCRCLDNCSGKLCNAGAKYGLGGGGLCPDTLVCCCGGGCDDPASAHAEMFAPIQMEEPYIAPYSEPKPNGFNNFYYGTQLEMIAIAALVPICILGCVFCLWLMIDRHQQGKRIELLECDGV